MISEQSPPKSPRGFTLVELLVVMAILGVVASTTLLRLNFSGGGDDQEYQQILAFLRRQHARTLRTTQTLTIQFDDKNQRILSLGPEEEVVDRLTLERWSIQEPDRITVSPLNGRSGELALESKSGAQRAIARDWIIGFVPRDPAREDS